MHARINSIRSLLFCCAALLLASGLQAQKRTFTVDLQAGPVFSTVKPDPSDAFDAKFRVGFFAGANLCLTFSEKWAVPIAVQYSQRGFQYETEGAFFIQNGQLALYRGRVDYRLGYLDVQPQLEFRPVEALGIAVGPYLSFRLAEQIKLGDVIDWTSTKDDELFASTDFGLAAKLTGNLGPAYLFAAFQLGLSNISNVELTDANGQPMGELGLKNRAVFVGAGWRF
ncbi:MAG: PorT family protein [Lewinellaceae bacterium]|nr:PorT family protein [Lewinellaceae bacterium]